MEKKQNEKVEILKGKIPARELIEDSVANFRAVKERKAYSCVFAGIKELRDRKVAEFFYRINGSHIGIIHFDIKQHEDKINRYIDFNGQKDMTQVHILHPVYSQINPVLERHNL